MRHIVLELSQEFFETRDWDAWAMHHVKSNRKSELIGLDRKVIIWANAILPFFLAYDRKEHDMQLEQLLFRILHGSSTGSIQPKNAFHGATFVDFILSSSQTEQLRIPAGDAPGPCRFLPEFLPGLC